METEQCRIDLYSSKKYYAVKIRENIFTAKNIYGRDLVKAYKLRHQIFAEQLRWVPRTKSNLEIDDYDSGSIHFGAFIDRELVAYLRLIIPENQFMLENEFIDLIGQGHTIRKFHDTAEVSRLCISQRGRTHRSISTPYGTFDIVMLLYKSIYTWCNMNGVRYLYAVIAQELFRLIRAKGFPCDPIGPFTDMPGGVTAVAVIMDWRDFEERNASKRQLVWFSRNQPDRGIELLPRLETC